ncbi:hypothetical protein F5X97DRAFT_202072 [Nemania serpens]|nr:hypothetical protein F5X97DRAFT_202072 [Nemania serpens]
MSDEIADVRLPGQASTSRNINETFVRCLDLYRNLAAHILENDNSNTEGGDDIDSNHLLDEFGRLRIWGDQTKAALEPKARSSLDDFLRNEERLSEEVKEVLGQLEIGLSIALSTAKDTDQQRSAPKGDASDRTISHSDYSSESGSEDSTDWGSKRPKSSRLSIIMSHIFEYIQLLYHFGSLLRRPGLKGRYLRHDDSEGRHPMTIFDTCHIEEKLRHWDRQAAGGIGVSPEKEEAVTEQIISERLACESANNIPQYVLSRRFAKANSQRREQLKYWINNPYRLDGPQGPEGKKIIGKSALKTKPKKGDAATEDETATVKPESKKSKSEKSRSTALSFSTVAESALPGSGTEMGRPQTVYAESVVAGKWSARVPPPPKPAIVIDGTEQYECPYCYMSLDAKLVKDRTAWKRHVFRDLRPYSCTFMECTNPNKLYTTRHEWKYHEMQIHRRNWVCHKCDCKFEEKDVLVQHLRDNHSGNWTDRQLSIILEMSERPMDESVILPCPLCKSQLSLAKLFDHLAAHMEEISLFVLPNNSEPGDNTNSNDAMRTDTENGSDGMEPSPQSSLRFSDIAQSDREAVEGEDSIPYIQLPASNPSDGAEAQVKGETGASSSVSRIPFDSSVIPDIDTIIDQLLEARHFPRGSPVHLTMEVILHLCEKSRIIFLSQPILLELLTPLKIVGDLQGQYHDLLRMFGCNGFPPEANYLFMGNYVDIEGQSVETICLLLAYKIKYPENFFLLRGSHEIERVNRDLGFYSECGKKGGTALWETFNGVFDCLPLAAIIADGIFVVHGGLSPDLTSMEQIRQVTRPTPVSCIHLIRFVVSLRNVDIATRFPPKMGGFGIFFGPVLETISWDGLKATVRGSPSYSGLTLFHAS